MRPLRVALLFLLVSSVSSARAVDLIVAELQITPPAQTLRRGDFGTMTFSIECVAEAPLISASAGFTHRSFGPASTLLPFRVAETAPCFYTVEGPSPRPGEPPTNVMVLLFWPKPVGVGERRSCAVGFRVSPDAAGPFVQQFGFQARSGELTQSVTRFVAFPLGDPPPLVPTLSPHWLLLLGGLVAGIGAWAIRR